MGTEKEPSMMEFETTWEAIKQVTGWRRYSELASFLGIKSGSLSGAKRRGHMPVEWLFKISQHFGVSLDYLVYLVGPSGLPERRHYSPDEPRSASIEAIAALYAGKPIHTQLETLRGSSATDVESVLNAVIEVMTSDDAETKAALTQNAIALQKAVRNSREIGELKRDMEIIKKRLLEPREDDFKTQGQQREEKNLGGNGE